MSSYRSDLTDRIDKVDTDENDDLADLLVDIKSQLEEQDGTIEELRDEVRELTQDSEDHYDEVSRLEALVEAASPIQEARMNGCASGIEEVLEVAYRYACGKFGPGSDEAGAFEQLLKV